MKFVLLNMLSIVLLGTGNVAHHLFDAFSKDKSLHVRQVYGRSPKSLANFTASCDTTSSLKNIAEAAIYIIAVSDDAIAEVAKALSEKEGLVVHTSGSIPMQVVTSKRKGVFYPLQTFTHGKHVDFTTIPICVEASSTSDLELLKELANKIVNTVSEVSSAQREKLHLAAVFVNNFTNHMYTIGHEICEKENLSFNLLKPLIKETALKLEELPPAKAQTGPAKRNDVLTMQKHLDQLESPIQKKLYQLVSESIKANQ